jgi:ribosome maturation factor RimP
MSQLTRQDIVGKIEQIAERVAASEGLEVVAVEFAGGGRSRLLRIYIDKPGGVTHGDCELVSLQVGTILDVEDVIPGERYTLEVSSPGVERKLVKPRDYERSVGQKIKVTLREPLAPGSNQRNYEGTLAGFADNVLVFEPQPGAEFRIPLDQVAKANLKFEW